MTCCRGGLSPSRGPGRALNAHRHHNGPLLAVPFQEACATFANNCCWVCRFDGAMIVEVWAYLDSAMVDYTIHRNENLVWQ